MDRGRKLKRYGRKDYTQLVEFPVEIIGRDGVVRRYDFEQSIRLYQRRIGSAGLRYVDGAIVEAEINHCRQRIQQLRRSYFVRHGWPALEQLDVYDQTGPGLAADLAAFLRRCLAASPQADATLVLACLESQSRRSSIFITRSAEGLAEDQSFLVYMHCLDPNEDCPHRSAYFDELKMLQRAQSVGSQVERLVAFHHTSDCGLILTQVGGEALASDSDFRLAPVGRVSQPAEAELRPHQRAFQLLRQGRHRAALRRFVAAYESNPLSRQAYLGAIIAADLLGVVVMAESAALMGSRVLKEDSDLVYHLVAVFLRQHRWADAREALLEFERIAPEDPRLPLARATLACGQHQYQRARGILASADNADRVPRQLLTSQQNLGAQLLLRRSLIVVSLVTCCVGLAVNEWLPGWGLGVAIGGALIGLASGHACRKLFLASLGLPGSKGLRLVDIACLAKGPPKGHRPA